MKISSGAALDLFCLLLGLFFVSLSLQLPYGDIAYPERISSNTIRDLTLKSVGVDGMRKFNRENNEAAKNLKIKWGEFSTESKARCLKDLDRIEYKSYIYLQNCLLPNG